MTEMDFSSSVPPSMDNLTTTTRSDSLVVGDVDEIEEVDLPDSEEQESPEKMLALQDGCKFLTSAMQE